MRSGVAISIRGATFARSWRMLPEHLGHVDAPATFIQPAIRLLIDTLLYQSFLNVIVRGLERGRILASRFGSRQYRVLVKVLDRLFIDLHGRAEAGIEIIIQIELVGGDPPHLIFSERSQVPSRFIIFQGCKTLPEASETAIDISIGRSRRARQGGFIAHNPLIDQAIQNFSVTFRSEERRVGKE